jgi:hypothetical protein
VNESKPSTEPSPQRRRRLLRGALSAPVVLTISSGASATMTSNMRCVANQVNAPTTGRTYAAGTGVPSTVIRVQLYRNAAATKHYISGTELGSLAHPSRPVSWISNGQWQEFDPATNLRVGSPVTLSTSPTLTSPVKYANVQFDQLGYVMSVGKNTTTSTSMVAATCWNSFRAGPLV